MAESLTINGVATNTVPTGSPVVIGAYAQGVLNKYLGAQGTSGQDSGIPSTVGPQNGMRLGMPVDLTTVQMIIDAYENVKNSVTIPTTDAAPTQPGTAEPLPPL